jgi:hypothetical protein
LDVSFSQRFDSRAASRSPLLDPRLRSKVGIVAKFSKLMYAGWGIRPPIETVFEQARADLVLGYDRTSVLVRP